MKKIIGFVRSNLLVIFLASAIVFLILGKQNVSYSPPRSMMEGLTQFDTANMGMTNSKMAYSPISGGESAPVTGMDRMITRDTNLSLQVKNVSQTIGNIEEIAKDSGGYMVDSSLSVPEGASSGNITIRVPAEDRPKVLTAIKSLGVKTVSENIIGTDVTDQYQNLEERLRLINLTKSKFESIQSQATAIRDILEVQRELINLQSQIDSIKGQQKYLEQTAKLTRISIYLSTDEFSLPYTPDQPWRPEVVFKQAVRSMVGNLRNLGTAIIWLVVYAPILATATLIIWLLKKRVDR